MLAASAVRAELKYFRAQHWVTGRVLSGIDPDGRAVPADGRRIALSRGGSVFSTDTLITGNRYLINAFYQISPEATWAPGDILKVAVVPQGDGYTAEQVFTSSGEGYEILPDMSLSSEVVPLGGPRVSLTCLLEGFLTDRATPVMRRAIVEVEARQGTSPDNATIIAGVATIELGSSGTGSNGFGIGALPGGDEYYFVVHHKVPGIASGPNHLPVITAIKHRFTGTGDTRTIALDFIDGTQAYTLSGQITAEAEVSSSRFALRAGDIDANQIVDVGDNSVWFDRFQRYNGTLPDDPTKPIFQADLDGNGIIDVGDNSVWFGSFDALKSQTGKHGYVP